MSKLAFLGTGLLGAGFAEAAAKRGHTVTAWNRTPEKAKALEAHGVKAHATAAAAIVGADRVHLILKDDVVVDTVLKACGPAIKQTIVIDHSTNSPEATAERAERLAKQGVRYLSAPVFMGPQAARDAAGIMLAAGPRALFESVKADLATMTGRVEYLGERPDLAAAYKLFGNAMILSIAAGLADVYAIAANLSIKPADALNLFTYFNPAGLLAVRGKAMAAGDWKASFELTMARKDAGLMIEASGNLPLAILPAIAERMDVLIEAGYGDCDTGVLAIDAIEASQQQ
jgi:3-hydroxyisobutyrate dehydrogenase